MNHASNTHQYDMGQGMLWYAPKPQKRQILTICVATRVGIPTICIRVRTANLWKLIEKTKGIVSDKDVDRKICIPHFGHQLYIQSRRAHTLDPNNTPSQAHSQTRKRHLPQYLKL